MDQMNANQSDGSSIAPNLNGQSCINPTPARPTMQYTTPANDGTTTMNDTLNS